MALVAAFVAFGFLVGPEGNVVLDVALGYVVSIPLVVWALYLYRKLDVRVGSVLGKPRFRRAYRWVALALPLLVFSLGFMWLVLVGFSWIVPDWVQAFIGMPDDPVIYPGRPILSLFAVGYVVVVGPISEELFFRGALVDYWTPRWGARRAVVVSAALFGILHFDLVGAVVFALCMSLLYRHTGTLLLPMACHALHNLLLVAADAIPGTDTWLTTLDSVRASWWLAIALLASVIVLLLTVRRLRPAGLQP